jgi:hypothetical protein
LIDLGFEIGRFFDQGRHNLGIACCLGEFEKYRRLTREIVPANHCTFPVLPTPHTSRWNRDFVPPEMYKSVPKSCASNYSGGLSSLENRYL